MKSIVIGFLSTADGNLPSASLFSIFLFTEKFFLLKKAELYYIIGTQFVFSVSYKADIGCIILGGKKHEVSDSMYSG